MGTDLDAFLTAIGMGMLKRQAAKLVKSEITFTTTADGFDFVNASGVTTERKTYKWGVAAEDKDPVGEQGTQVWNMEGEKMTGVFTYKSGMTIAIERTISGDVMTQTMTYKDSKCVRVFKRV